MKALEITGLKKSFVSNFLTQRFRILKNITLCAEKGEIYGFLGPNGAGKTTTIKCILSLIRPDEGEISILGQSSKSRKSREKVGFLPEHPYFYDYLTGKELLTFTGMLFGISRKPLKEKTKRLIRLVGLEGKGDIKLRKFSKGMIQRIGLAQALIHDPDLLILDEPFSGLDPIGRKELRDIILSLKDKGKTIFFSSHILQDMEMIVDKVGIILAGELKKEGKLSDLISHSVQNYEIIITGIGEEILNRDKISYDSRDGNFIIRSETIEQTNRVIQTIHKNNGQVLEVTPVKRTLEDIFLEEVNQ